MRQSQLFTKTKKEIPADETSKNAQLLIRAGYIHKEMAGVYTILPLGLKVVDNIIQIIREEMNKEGGVEMRTSVLQNKESWEKTGRWDDNVVDNWFKTNLKNGTEVGLSFTNEEAYTNLMKDYIRSYKDLPVYAYDFKSVFRNEARAKSGVMRGREFYWKALYDFSKTEEEHNEFHDRMREAYKRIFSRVGIGELTFVTFASGGTFSEFSEEFQTLSDAGEDTIYIDERKKIAVNKEVYNDEVLNKLGLKKEELIEKKTIEIGNIFHLGTKFSEPLDLTYKDTEGKDNLVFMGSYGIGVTRLLGVIAEVLADDKGLVWPNAVAPFPVHLIALGKPDTGSYKEAEKIYEELTKHKVDVLFDDRELGAGEKFADSDLIGVPMRVVVSDKSLSAGGVEIKERKGENSEIISKEQLIKMYTNCCDDCNH